MHINIMVVKSYYNYTKIILLEKLYSFWTDAKYKIFALFPKIAWESTIRIIKKKFKEVLKTKMWETPH